MNGAEVLNFVWLQFYEALEVLFVDYQLPWGVSLGMFIVAATLLYFLADLIAPFLGIGSQADKAHKSAQNFNDRYGL